MSVGTDFAEASRGRRAGFAGWDWTGGEREGGPSPALPLPPLWVLSLWVSLLRLSLSQDQNQVGGVPVEVRPEGPRGQAAGRLLGRP